MKLPGKKDFKNAVREYALAARKVINFAKDEGYIVRLSLIGQHVLEFVSYQQMQELKAGR